MSRTYRKILRLGFAHACNTDYYRTKRRTFRRKARQRLHVDLEDFVHPEKLSKFKDSWDEPTDGTWLVDWNYIKYNLEDALAGRPNRSIADVKYDMKHYGRYLKPNKYSKCLKKYKT